MTVADLREILGDPDLPPDLPVRVQLRPFGPCLVGQLDGAHGQLAGDDPHLVLELGAVHFADKEASR